MLKKLEKREYSSAVALKADIDKIWQNAITYNGVTSWIMKVGEVGRPRQRKIGKSLPSPLHFTGLCSRDRTNGFAERISLYPSLSSPAGWPHSLRSRPSYSVFPRFSCRTWTSCANWPTRSSAK